MVTGHAALALLGKRARRTVPLTLLVVAAYASDIAELLLNLARVDDHDLVNLLSHSLTSDVLAGSVLALGYWLVRRDALGGLVLGLVLLSHWPADLITGHGKPTWPGGPELGFFLYRHEAADFVLEAGLLLLTWWLWRRSSRAAGAGAPAAARPRHPVSPLVRALPLLLLPLQLTFNVMGYLDAWDWKTVMLRGSRKAARTVKRTVTRLEPARHPALGPYRVEPAPPPAHRRPS